MLSHSVLLILFTGITLGPIVGLQWRAPATLRLLVANLRPERILHYHAMVLLGAALHVRDAGVLPDAAQWLATGGLLLALCYAAVFAIVGNDIEDLAIDRLSNPRRPLARGAIDVDRYRRLGHGALLVALLLAGIVGAAALAAVAAVSAIYFLYSCPPFRLKRVMIFAKLMIGANSAILAVTGFVLSGGDWSDFPLPWLLYLVFAVGLAANFIDLKDMAGDAAEGVRTLPVRVGMRRARQWILLATMLAYASAAWLLQAWSLVPLNAVLLFWHLRELQREPYVEARVFRVYLLGQSALIGALCLLSRYDLP